MRWFLFGVGGGPHSMLRWSSATDWLRYMLVSNMICSWCCWVNMATLVCEPWRSSRGFLWWWEEEFMVALLSLGVGFGGASWLTICARVVIVWVDFAQDLRE